MILTDDIYMYVKQLSWVFLPKRRFSTFNKAVEVFNIGTKKVVYTVPQALKKPISRCYYSKNAPHGIFWLIVVEVGRTRCPRFF